jgi:hypothetical protein
MIAVSRSGYICLFQALQIEYKDKPLRVLDEKFLPASECTLEAAKAMFQARFEDRAYSRKHGLLKPDAVRFLDEGGAEVLRYTSFDYLKECAAGKDNQPHSS